ncbi:unnamed protein product [Wuchereria bancrofti]|uniref:Uncharacterized protein n=1 Tax=Wuchereria bancrofti TaxID=6293 RepID=A0A3P7FAM1_WUCBA|nr:unnamed protein product [Wuchereria bancrofti]
MTTVLLTLIYKPCTSFLNFPSDNIRRLRILDVIGGYPSFFGAIYVHNDPSNDVLSRTETKSSRFMPLSTLLHFTIKNVDCSNLASVSSGCEVICSNAFNILLAEMLLYVFGIANSSGDVIAICKYPAFPTFTTAGQLTQLNDPNCTIKQQTAAFEKETIGSYVFGDEVRISGQLSLLRPDTNGLCTHLYEQPMKYKGCDVNNLVKFLSNQMNGTEVCDQTGDQCVVPILIDVVTASSDQKCDNYSVMSVRVATQKGSILGALIEFLPSSNKCRENYCILTTKISFEEVTQRFLNKMKMSRYENSEGRFRCPSEVTCPAELFYFLNTFDVGEFSAQFFVLIPLFMLLLFHMS